MNGFTFWSSYFESGKELSTKAEGELYRMIVHYIFEGVELDCPGVVKSVFNALKPGLDISIRRSESKSKRNQNGIKTESNRHQNGIKTESKRNQIDIKSTSNRDVGIGIDIDIDNNIYTPPTPSKEGDTPKVEEMGYSPELSETVKDWLSYKKEKRQTYKPTGLKTLLTQIKQHAEKYGDKAVIDLIHESMSSNYQGIIFDRLSKARAAPKKQNFQQREYDYDALEKKLLNGG